MEYRYDNEIIFNVYRGDVFYVRLEDIDKREGSEQAGTRPVVCIQNDIGNAYSPTTIVAVLTSRTDKKPLPTHVLIDVDKEKDCTLKLDSYVLCEQIRTISKTRILSTKGHLSNETMKKIDKAIKISLQLD